MTVMIEGSNSSVERTLMRLDTALSPIAIAGFLGATVSPYLRGRAERRFAGEGDDVVGAWLPLSEVTVEIRESMGYGAGPINHRTGELEEYITQGRHSIQMEPMGASLEMPGNPPTGILKKKVETAQAGSTGSKNSGGWGATEPRPVLGMNGQDTVFVLSALAFYVQKAIGR